MASRIWILQFFAQVALAWLRGVSELCSNEKYITDQGYSVHIAKIHVLAKILDWDDSLHDFCLLPRYVFLRIEVQFFLVFIGK